MPFNETGYGRDRDELGRIKPSKIDGNNSLKAQAKVENKRKVPEKYPTFTDYVSLSKWEKFKNININLKAYIIFLTGENTHKEIRQNFISGLARYIDKNNNINKEQIDRIYHHAKVSFENHKRAKENTKKRKCFQKIDKRLKSSVYPFNTVSSLFGIRKPLIRPPRANTDIGRTNTTSNENRNINPENGNISQDTDNTNKALNNEEINNFQEDDDTDNSKKPATSNETEETGETDETDETEEILIDNLKDLKIDEAEKLLNWRKMSLESCKGLNLKELFILEKGFKIENGCIPHLEEDFQAWNNKRLDNISKLFTPTHMELLTDSDQLLKASDILSPDFIDKGVNFKKSLEGVPETEGVVYDFETSRDANNDLARYTHGEILGEMVSRLDMRDEYPLRLLQTFITAYLKKENIYDTSIITGEWNAETQKFLEDNILNDPEFKKEINYKKYEQAIYKVLSSHHHFDTSSLNSTFESFSEHSKRNKDYWENPESYWRNQTLEGPREFVGISDLGNGSSYKLEEQSFLNSHMQEFNGKLAEFLKLTQIREGDSIDDTSRIKMEQIWNTIPLDQINAIYNLFASKPEEQEKFNNYLKDNNLPNIDINDMSLKRLVLEQDFSFNPIAKYCYERIWISCQNEIISESGKTLQYLSDKTGDTALNIKNKVLEFFLPGISIRPEKAENGIFYFRDENNLDTLYSFNPENGEISQQGNISLEDEGIISFRSGGSKGNLLQKIQGFQNIVDIDLLDILPDKNPKNMEELENEILNKIQSKIAVEKVADTSVVTKELLKLKNERNVCHNGIVGDLKQLLNIEDDYLYETSGENYKIFFNLLKTFERIDIEYPNDNKPLNSMKLLLDKICNSTESFTLLKPSLLENNREGDASEEISQENTDGEIQHSQKVSRGPHIIKNLIDPNTQLFDINLINDLAYNGEIDQYLAERKYDRIIAEIQKNRELKIAKENYEKEIAKLYADTHNELHGLNEDVELFANISALENEGDFLS